MKELAVAGILRAAARAVRRAPKMAAIMLDDLAKLVEAEAARDKERAPEYRREQLAADRRLAADLRREAATKKRRR